MKSNRKGAPGKGLLCSLHLSSLWPAPLPHPLCLIKACLPSREQCSCHSPRNQSGHSSVQTQKCPDTEMGPFCFSVSFSECRSPSQNPWQTSLGAHWSELGYKPTPNPVLGRRTALDSPGLSDGAGAKASFPWSPLHMEDSGMPEQNLTLERKTWSADAGETVCCSYTILFVFFKSHWYLKFLNYTWTSLVVQGLRICLPMQGTQIRFLVWKNPTCCRQLNSCTMTSESEP